MGAFDVIISITIVSAFVIFIGSKIYSHEKEHLDPVIDKVKGWFSKKDDGDDELDPNADFEISFRGQQY